MAIQKVFVSNQNEVDPAITGYLAQGFVVANRTPTTVTLQKKKEFKILWAVIGFLLCVLPLFVYLIIYSIQADVEIVEISVR